HVAEDRDARLRAPETGGAELFGEIVVAGGCLAAPRRGHRDRVRKANALGLHAQTGGARAISPLGESSGLGESSERAQETLMAARKNIPVHPTSPAECSVDEHARRVPPRERPSEAAFRRAASLFRAAGEITRLRLLA